MAQRVCIIGAGVVGLATAYALVREGFDVTLVEARERGGLETSYANGGQLSYRYVAPLADSGVPAQTLGWLLRNDAPLRLRPRLDPAQWRWLLGFLAACRGSLNRRNAAHLLRLALLSQRTLQAWREEDGLDGFDWRRNGKLVAFRQPASFARARQGLADPSAQFVLTAAECLALEPALSAAPFVGGIHTPDEEVADCHAFCVQLAERLQASGHCRQLHGRRVTKIVEGGAAVRGVEVGGDLIEADHVVLAAGYRSAELMLPGLRLPLYPLKGYSLTLPVGAQHRAPDTSITDYDRKIVYARIGERLRIAAMVDIVGFDPASSPRAWHCCASRRGTRSRRAAISTPPSNGPACARPRPPGYRWWATAATATSGSTSATARSASPWPAAAGACWPSRSAAARRASIPLACFRAARWLAEFPSTWSTPMEPTRIATNDRLSAAVCFDALVFLSGQVPGQAEDIHGQTREVLAKIDALLAEAGSRKERILSATIYLKDIARDFAALNEVWTQWLPIGQAPSRTTVQAELARPSVLVEITVVAARG